MSSSTDRIEKQLRLDSPRSRVWRALTDHAQFSSWFGVAFTTPFAVGKPTAGLVGFKGYDNITMEVIVEAIDPEHHFAFRWHPYALEAGVDYSKEPRTLVTFTLADDGDGTLLTVTETGFDAIPAHRRAKAFEMNSNGWASQLRNILKYLGAGMAADPTR